MANDRFIRTYRQGSIINTEIWIDTQTGVNYIYHSSGNSGGLCPLYDSDGKVVVTPIEDKE